MGLVNYYGDFIQDLATIAQPLYQLTKQDQSWKWGGAEQAALEKLEQLLSEPPVLVQNDPDVPVLLACDASGICIGAIWSHVGPNGKEQPIAFASRS